jgi:hypothetical protein
LAIDNIGVKRSGDSSSGFGIVTHLVDVVVHMATSVKSQKALGAIVCDTYIYIQSTFTHTHTHYPRCMTVGASRQYSSSYDMHVSSSSYDMHVSSSCMPKYLSTGARGVASNH